MNNETHQELKKTFYNFEWRLAVGQRIREARKKYKVHQENGKFAIPYYTCAELEKIVFDENSKWKTNYIGKISAIELGRPKMDSIPFVYTEILPKIAKVLNVSLSWLLGKDESIQSPIQPTLFKPEEGKPIFREIDKKDDKSRRDDVKIEINDYDSAFQTEKEMLCAYGFVPRDISQVTNLVEFARLFKVCKGVLDNGVSVSQFNFMLNLIFDYVKSNGKVILWKVDEVNNNGNN